MVYELFRKYRKTVEDFHSIDARGRGKGNFDAQHNGFTTSRLELELLAVLPSLCSVT